MSLNENWSGHCVRSRHNFKGSLTLCMLNIIRKKLYMIYKVPYVPYVSLLTYVTYGYNDILGIFFRYVNPYVFDVSNFEFANQFFISLNSL